MKVVGKEIFDPIGALITFGSEEETIRIANDTEHGLPSVMWTQDANRAHRVASPREAGTRRSVSEEKKI